VAKPVLFPAIASSEPLLVFVLAGVIFAALPIRQPPFPHAVGWGGQDYPVKKLREWQTTL
jgi:hypothetical protein